MTNHAQHIPGIGGADIVAGSRRRWWLTLPVLCIPVLLVQIDTSIVNLGVQPIRSHFGASTDAMQWVVDSYNLLYAVLLLTGGQLADLYGRRRILMHGVTIFTAASLLCAAAPTIPILIVGRALAGVGAALLLPATLAVIRVVWPIPSERGAALGIWAACNGLALALGPPLGGGIGIIASGLLLVGASVHVSSLIPVEVGCALTGLGMGLATGPLMGVAVGAVPAARSGTASALINVARMIGATLGVALLGAVFALSSSATAGLQLAMLLGGSTQLVAAIVAFTMPPHVTYRVVHS